MDATISLHTYGRRSSWFSDQLRRLSVGSFRLIVLLLGAAVLAAFSLLMLSYRQTTQPVESSLTRLQSISQLAQQTAGARLQAAQYLESGTQADYLQGEAALSALVESVESASAAQPIEYLALRQLEATSGDALNTFRSLGSLVSGGADEQTQAVLRQQLSAALSTLDKQTYAALESSVVAAGSLLNTSAATLANVGVALLIVVVILFALSLFAVSVISRHSAYALRQIGQAAEQITLGHYDTRIDLRSETNTDIVRLGEAFNRMAENLKTALQSESAANKQNHMQLMKLARQERMTAILEERQRIARELHDSVKQQLFSITLSANAALNLLNHSPEMVRTHLEHIRHAGQTAQTEMTGLVEELAPVPLQEKRLDEALLSALTPLCEIHGLKLLWRVEGTNTLTISQEHALFRAVQEAVSNVVRHSSATVLRVSVNYGLVTQVMVEDNGCGFDPDAVPATSAGLSLMQTRLKRVGGRCELDSAPGTGTRLKILLDLRRTAVPRP